MADTITITDASDIWKTRGPKARPHHVTTVDDSYEPFRYGHPHGHRGVRAGSEDGWRGFGYMVHDNDRYGGISSEDYLD